MGVCVVFGGLQFQGCLELELSVIKGQGPSHHFQNFNKFLKENL